MPQQTDVPTLEDALRKAGSRRGTRRWLLERATVGAAGIAAGDALDPAGAALAKAGHNSIGAFGTVAVTTEALTVTLLTEVLRRANLNSVPAGDLAVFEGAYAAEVDHFRFARRYWTTTTTKLSEHRVLAETLIGATPPNNVGFEAFSIQRPQGIETALQGAGIGFGTQGRAPGAFYTLPHPFMPPPVKINSSKPS